MAADMARGRKRAKKIPAGLKNKTQPPDKKDEHENQTASRRG